MLLRNAVPLALLLVAGCRAPAWVDLEEGGLAPLGHETTWTSKVDPAPTANASHLARALVDGEVVVEIRHSRGCFGGIRRVYAYRASGGSLSLSIDGWPRRVLEAEEAEATRRRLIEAWTSRDDHPFGHDLWHAATVTIELPGRSFEGQLAPDEQALFAAVGWS